MVTWKNAIITTLGIAILYAMFGIGWFAGGEEQAKKAKKAQIARKEVEEHLRMEKQVNVMLTEDAMQEIMKTRKMQGEILQLRTALSIASSKRTIAQCERARFERELAEEKAERQAVKEELAEAKARLSENSARSNEMALKLYCLERRTWRDLLGLEIEQACMAVDDMIAKALNVPAPVPVRKPSESPAYKTPKRMPDAPK